MRLAVVVVAALLSTVMVTKDANAYVLGVQVLGPPSVPKDFKTKRQSRPPVVDHRGTRNPPPIDPRSRPASRPSVRGRR
jgi:hypothetical protein